jgi:hypothetical protein
MTCTGKSIFFLISFVFGLHLQAENKHTEKQFYVPIISYLEGWKIEWDPEIAESDNAHFFVKSERPFPITFKESSFFYPRSG